MLSFVTTLARSLLTALALAALAAGCAPGMARPSVEDDVIAVTGSGRFSASPDTAVLTLGVEATAATLGEATGDAGRRMTAVVARVKSFGVADADIATVVYSVDPRMAPMAPMDPTRRDEAPRIVGYRVTNVVQVTVRKISDAGPILDAAVPAGANTVRGVRFTLADPSAAQSQARAEAVRDALAKARQLATAAGMTLGPVLSIREGGSVPQFVPMRAMATRPDAPPIEPGQLEVTVSVDLRQAIQR
jgi:uncharacterized protein YggE